MSLVDFLIEKETINLRVAVRNWKQAVGCGVRLLIDRGVAESRYHQAIIKSVKKNGPYFVLMPRVALPHARPEEGALAQGFSLITLQRAVRFGSVENDPVSILLTFCATDATAQLEGALAQAVTIFEDEDRIDNMINCTTVPEMINILKKVDFSDLG